MMRFLTVGVTLLFFVWCVELGTSEVIQSAPEEEEAVPNEYLFVIDTEGIRHEQKVAEAMEIARRKCRTENNNVPNSASAVGRKIKLNQNKDMFKVKGSLGTVNEIKTELRLKNMKFTVGKNYICRISEDVCQDRSLQDQMWGLDRIDERGRTEQVENFQIQGNGEGTYIYVLDTGVANHPEFMNRLIEEAEISKPFGTHEDGHGHGTHVAGTAAGRNVGVAPGATIVPVKVLSDAGWGTTEGIVQAIREVADNVVRKNQSGKAVINMSLGSGYIKKIQTVQDSPYVDAINDAVDMGVVVVVAAGNSGDGRKGDAAHFVPAAVASAITVASSDANDARSGFSNYGSTVDIFAPGSIIYSSLIDNGYGSYSGTSMASPHVAGAVACRMSAVDGQTPADVEAYLISQSTKNVLDLACTRRQPRSCQRTPNYLLNLQCSGSYGCDK